MPSHDLIDPRHDDLVRELRATRPLATPELRERVRAVAAREPEPAAPRRFALPRYGATLRVRVKNLDALSAATRDAVRATRRLGGYVALVDFNSPTVHRGDAHVVARVPAGRVQDAIARFEGLGTIVAQHVRVVDVQRTVDEQGQAIRTLRSEIAQVRADLARAQTPSERARLQAKLDSDLVRLRSLVRTRAAMVARAQFARIDLT